MKSASCSGFALLYYLSIDNDPGKFLILAKQFYLATNEISLFKAVAN